MTAVIIALAGMAIIASALFVVAILSDWSRCDDKEKRKEK